MCELSDIEYMLNMIEKAKNNEAENTENPLWGLNRIAIYIADYMLGENTDKSKDEVKGEFINYFNSDAAKKWQATLKTFIKADSADGGSIQSCVCEFFKNERKVFETMAIACGCTREDDADFFDAYEIYKNGFGIN